MIVRQLIPAKFFHYDTVSLYQATFHVNKPKERDTPLHLLIAKGESGPYSTKNQSTLCAAK